MVHIAGLVFLGVAVVLFCIHAFSPEPPSPKLSPIGLAFFSGGMLALNVP